MDGFNLNHTVNPYDWVVSSDLSNIFSTIYYNNVLNMHKVYNAIYWCLGHPAERVRQGVLKAIYQVIHLVNVENAVVRPYAEHVRQACRTCSAGCLKHQYIRLYTF